MNPSQESKVFDRIEEFLHRLWVIPCCILDPQSFTCGVTITPITLAPTPQSLAGSIHDRIDMQRE